MKITKEKAVDLFKSLNDVGNLQGVKFAYAVARNISLLNSEVDAIQKAIEAHDDFRKYDEERVALAKKHAVKVDGKEKVEDGQYVVEDQEKFETEFKELQEKHKNALDVREKQKNDFKELLKEELEIDLFTIPVEYVPENITPAQMEGILLIVADAKAIKE